VFVYGKAHAMVCTKGVVMRHDLLLGARRRIAQHAGVATAIEPAMDQLWTGAGRASLEQGDMLFVLPDDAVCDRSLCTLLWRCHA
jgi:hypothetical protein